jgi:hypothetical protein
MSCGTSTSLTPGSRRIFAASSEAVLCVALMSVPLIWMSMGVGCPRLMHGIDESAGLEEGADVRQLGADALTHALHVVVAADVVVFLAS